MKDKRYHLPYLEDVRSRRHVCFAEQLRSANRVITKLYNDQLGSSDIGISQLSLLVRLYYFERISMSKLAEELETDRTTLVRNVQILERSGHVEIVSGKDRRSRLVQLTDKGFAALEEAIPHWLEAQQTLRDALGDSRWDTLFDGLRQLVKVAPSGE